jgi:cyclohexanone monooxygenase
LESQVAGVLLVDNASVGIDWGRIDSLSSDNLKIDLIKLENNVGLGGGLNVGVNFSRKLNFPFLLLLDQDSLPNSMMVSKLHTAYERLNTVSAVAAVGPRFIDPISGHLSKFKASTGGYEGGFAEVDLVQDGWTDIIGNLLIRLRQDASPDLSPEGLARNLELADFEKMEQIRARVENIVSDPSTAEHLKPWYRQFCKRPCFHDDYLATFNRPTVELVDTDGRGVDYITEKGVVANGIEYEIDCLIYATGFEVGTNFSRRAGYEIYGVGGKSLTQHWDDGARTFHGFHSRGFPNCFIVSGVQSGFTVNFPHMLEEQARHIGYILNQISEQGATRIETSEESEQWWVDRIISLSQNNIKFLESCTPGYYNNEGKPAARSVQGGSYGGGPVAFVQVLEQWRADGGMRGLITS